MVTVGVLRRWMRVVVRLASMAALSGLEGFGQVRARARARTRTRADEDEVHQRHLGVNRLQAGYSQWQRRGPQ